jgi:hypothetical protein
MDIPFLAAKFVLQVPPPLYRHYFRQAQFPSFNGLINVGQEFSPEYGHNGTNRQKISRLLCAYPSAPIVQTTFCYKTMNVRMDHHRLTPCVQCGNDPGFSANMSFIEKEFIERVPDARKEQIGHLPYIQEPYRIKVMGQGEDHVVMAASENSFLLPLKPLLYLKPIALRTDTMSA